MAKSELVAEFVAEPMSSAVLTTEYTPIVPTIPTGPGTVVSIDLDAINVYYQQLWQLHDQLTAAYERAAATVRSGQPEVRLVTPNEIDGVAKAVRIAGNLAGEGNHGLLHSLRMAQSMVERNLADLYASYQAYLDTDTAAATQLDQSLATLGGS